MLLVLVTYASYLGLMAYSTPSMDSLSLLVGTLVSSPQKQETAADSGVGG
jgi:hypothetical protein